MHLGVEIFGREVLVKYAWVCIWSGNFRGGVFVFLRLENFFAGVFCVFRGGIAFLVESLQFFYDMI